MFFFLLVVRFYDFIFGNCLVRYSFILWVKEIEEVSYIYREKNDVDLQRGIYLGDGERVYWGLSVFLEVFVFEIRFIFFIVLDCSFFFVKQLRIL